MLQPHSACRSVVRRGSWLAAACLLPLLSTGCFTLPTANPLAALQSTSKVKQVSMEEPAMEAPPSPKNPNQVRLAYAKLMEDAGRLQDAHKQYEVVSAAEPKNVAALVGLGRVELAIGRPEDAERTFKKALKHAPDSAPALAGLGRAYAAQNEWARSVEALSTALLAAPHDAQVRYDLAVVLVHQGDVDSALPHFIRTIGDAEAHYNTALILQQEGRLAEAEQHFAIAVTKKPSLTEAHRWLTHLRGSSGDSTLQLPGDGAPVVTSPIAPATHHSPEKPVINAATITPPAGRRLSLQQAEQLENQLPYHGS